MKFIRFRPVGTFMVNSYALVSDKNNAVIIDAPYSSLNGADNLISEGIQIQKILLTHGHCDHIECLDKLADKTGASVYIHHNDVNKLTDSKASLFDCFSDVFGSPYIKSGVNIVEIKDGDIIELDEIKITVMHTPGHTSGGVCYIVKDMIFCGDTLFMGSIGRTDMYDGNSKALTDSLNKIANINGEYKNYKLYPGHGFSTTLLDEKDRNPYLMRGMDL